MNIDFVNGVFVTRLTAEVPNDVVNSKLAQNQLIKEIIEAGYNENVELNTERAKELMNIFVKDYDNPEVVEFNKYFAITPTKKLKTGIFKWYKNVFEFDNNLKATFLVYSGYNESLTRAYIQKFSRQFTLINETEKEFHKPALEFDSEEIKALMQHVYSGGTSRFFVRELMTNYVLFVKTIDDLMEKSVDRKEFEHNWLVKSREETLSRANKNAELSYDVLMEIMRREDNVQASCVMLLCYLGVKTGTKDNEMTELLVSDWNPQKRMLSIRKTKGESRIIQLTKEEAGYVDKLIATRSVMVDGTVKFLPETPYLFKPYNRTRGIVVKYFTFRQRLKGLSEKYHDLLNGANLTNNYLSRRGRLKYLHDEFEGKYDYKTTPNDNFSKAMGRMAIRYVLKEYDEGQGSKSGFWTRTKYEYESEYGSIEEVTKRLYNK